MYYFFTKNSCCAVSRYNTAEVERNHFSYSLFLLKTKSIRIIVYIAYIINVNYTVLRSGKKKKLRIYCCFYSASQFRIYTGALLRNLLFRYQNKTSIISIQKKKKKNRVNIIVISKDFSNMNIERANFLL